MKVNIKQVMLGTAALAGLLVTSQAVANADTLTIHSGDTVWSYSQKYNVSVKQIAAENNLSDASLIIAGQKINIPGVKTTDKASKTTTTASASSAKSTSAATSTSSQATSAAVISSTTTTSASSTSQAASSSSVATSAAVQSSSNSTASVSSATSAATSSTTSSSVATSSASTQSSAVTSSATTQSSAATSSVSTQSAASQSTSTASAQSASATETTYSTNSNSTSTKSVSTSSATYGSAISAAYSLVGTPYGTGSGQLDCSAFTQLAFAKAGITIGRTTSQQAALGSHVAFSQAQAGDLVFWGNSSNPYHVAIYLGGGQYIGAHDYGDPASVKSTAYFTPSFAIHM
ncbi:gamma-D-glutamyl-meso-diaminopimelate peptidase [Lactobacillus sp. CBA3605]|uniref:C40 family peptidase n=1 Tax=Lactobacillus sp. CBA3605 TaxID=2099788 RepID=UPI000CFC1DA2|nr:C40 family peptidase [Lactobacillus sp. CBA3605]AVK61384.1 gamma-D-glutamyl-meso-diaminopimelate peptidase [Lactobacillus sp. CBA3605]